jgi:hypothetical protein
MQMKNILSSAAMRFIPLLSILWLISCREAKKPANDSQTSQYIYYDKWRTPGDPFDNLLKDKPVQVIIRSYSTTDSSLQEPTGQLYDEYIYRFDEQGNCIHYRSNVFGDTTEADYGYTENGFQFSENRLTHNGTQKTIIRTQKSMPINSHAYRTQFYKQNELIDTTITSFDADGKVTITWPPGNPEIESGQRWYKDGRLVKTVYITKRRVDTTYYERDKNCILQAINNEEKQDIFQNNEKGDPVVHLLYVNHALYLETRIRYQYDAHNNWIRRFLITKPGNSPKGSNIGQLQVREIKYM